MVGTDRLKQKVHVIFNKTIYPHSVFLNKYLKTRKGLQTHIRVQTKEYRKKISDVTSKRLYKQ